MCVLCSCCYVVEQYCNEEKSSVSFKYLNLLLFVKSMVNWVKATFYGNNVQLVMNFTTLKKASCISFLCRADSNKHKYIENNAKQFKHMLKL